MIFRRFKKEEMDYATHGLYRYPGKFIPQIPCFLIQQFSKKYDIVLDPFCGSGTTLVEANLLHRSSYGIDSNPVARLITKVKTKKINIFHLPFFEDFKTDEADEGINEECEKFKYSYLFNPENLMQLLYLRKKIQSGNYDDDMKDFYLVCLLSIAKMCANIDEHKARIIRKRKAVINVSEIFKKKVCENLKNFVHLNTQVFAEVIGDNAKKIPLNNNTVDLVVTSPPYLNALNYREIHKIELALLNEEIDDENYIGVDKEVADENVESKKLMALEIYFKDMGDAISEIDRVTKRHGRCCIIIDKDRKIQNVKFKFADELTERAKQSNFVPEDKFYRYTTKENKSKGERIIVFRKI